MVWSRQDIVDRSVDYIFGEMSATDRQSYEAALKSHPDLLEQIVKLKNTSRKFAHLQCRPLPSGLLETLNMNAEMYVRRVGRAMPEPGESIIARLAGLLFQPAAATGLVALLVVGVGALVVEHGGIKNESSIKGTAELVHEIKGEQRPAMASIEDERTVAPVAGEAVEEKVVPNVDVARPDAVRPLAAKTAVTTHNDGIPEQAVSLAKNKHTQPDTRWQNDANAAKKPAHLASERGNGPPVGRTQATDGVTMDVTSPEIPAPRSPDVDNGVARPTVPNGVAGEDARKQQTDLGWEEGRDKYTVESAKVDNVASNSHEKWKNVAQPSQLGANQRPYAPGDSDTARVDEPVKKNSKPNETSTDITRGTTSPVQQQKLTPPSDVVQNDDGTQPYQSEWLRNIETQNVRSRAEAEPGSGNPKSVTLAQPAGVAAATTEDLGQPTTTITDSASQGGLEKMQTPSGDELFNNGDYSGAIRAYEREIAASPTNAAQVGHRLAIAYRRSNQFSKAIDKYQELYVRYPSYINRAAALAELAQLYLDQGRTQDAEKVIDLMENINAPTPKIASLRAQVALRRSKTGKTDPQAEPALERMKAPDSKPSDNIPTLKKAAAD